LYCQTVAPPSKSRGNAGAVAGGVIAALAVFGIAGACYFYRYAHARVCVWRLHMCTAVA
jgi:hypothetical protein